MIESPFNANQEGPDGNARNIMIKKTGPALRVDVDLDAMPPASAPRREFVQRFQEDIARTVNIQPDDVSVTGMRHAPNLDWYDNMHTGALWRRQQPRSLKKTTLRACCANVRKSLFLAADHSASLTRPITSPSPTPPSSQADYCRIQHGDPSKVGY